MPNFNTGANPGGILPVVTDLETPWQNSVVERHRALFKIAFEKACSLEAPTTEAEVNELIDFTFAEVNHRVGRAGFSPSQRVFGRQLRRPSSIQQSTTEAPAGTGGWRTRLRTQTEGWSARMVWTWRMRPE